MKRSTKYVGLEVHQATTVACVREESGRVTARGVLPTEERAFLEVGRHPAGRLLRRAPHLGPHAGVSPHVHYVVPGGGPSADGSAWVPARPDFFLPERALSWLCRADSGTR